MLHISSNFFPRFQLNRARRSKFVPLSLCIYIYIYRTGSNGKICHENDLLLLTCMLLILIFYSKTFLLLLIDIDRQFNLNHSIRFWKFLCIPNRAIISILTFFLNDNTLILIFFLNGSALLALTLFFSPILLLLLLFSQKLSSLIIFKLFPEIYVVSKVPNEWIYIGTKVTIIIK